MVISITLIIEQVYGTGAYMDNNDGLRMQYLEVPFFQAIQSVGFHSRASLTGSGMT